MYADTSPAWVSMIGNAVSDPPESGSRAATWPAPFASAAWVASLWPSSPRKISAAPSRFGSSPSFTTTYSSASLAARSSRRL